MEQLNITYGTGWFAINKRKFPSNHFVITPIGSTVIITHASGQEWLRGKFDQFRDHEGNGFDTISDLMSYLDDKAFNNGGGGGDGATNIVLTQDEYDALTPDPNTTYDIIE